MKEILIPIKASEELPERIGLYYVICDNGDKDMAYFYSNRKWDTLSLNNNEIYIWYKSVSI